MCRLLGYVSHREQSFLQLLSRDFEGFVALASVHKDGWGLAAQSSTESSPHITAIPEEADTSATFRSTIDRTKADGALLHFRWASAGLPHTNENTHPFHVGEFSFIHNGEIKPYDAIDPFISVEYKKELKGQTDSEHYFLLLLTEIDRLGLLPGIQSAISIIAKNATYSSINAMLLTRENLIVINEHKPDGAPAWATADYHDLRFRNDQDGFVVGSTGWDQSNWGLLPNHSIIVVNRQSTQTPMEYQVYPIENRQ